MRSVAVRFIVVLSLVFSIGGHWDIIQSVAWGKMIYELSQDAPIQTAIAKTLSGENPCDICKFVASGKKEHKEQQEVHNSNLKLYAINAPSKLKLFEPKVSDDDVIFSFHLSGLITPPEFPPPRFS